MPALVNVAAPVIFPVSSNGTERVAVIEPAKSMAPERVRLFVPVTEKSSLIRTVFERDRPFAVDCSVRVSGPLLSSMSNSPVPSAVLLPRIKVPCSKRVPPEYELLPESVTVLVSL